MEISARCGGIQNNITPNSWMGLTRPARSLSVSPSEAMSALQLSISCFHIKYHHALITVQRPNHNQRPLRSAESQNSTIAAAAAATPARLCLTWVASPVKTGGAAPPVGVCPCVVDEGDVLVDVPGREPSTDELVGSVMDPMADEVSVTAPAPDDDMVVEGDAPEVDAVSVAVAEAVGVGVASPTGGIEMATPAEEHCLMTTFDTAGAWSAGQIFADSGERSRLTCLFGDATG